MSRAGVVKYAMVRIDGFDRPQRRHPLEVGGRPRDLPVHRDASRALPEVRLKLPLAKPMKGSPNA